MVFLENRITNDLYTQSLYIHNFPKTLVDSGLYECNECDDHDHPHQHQHQMKNHVQSGSNWLQVSLRQDVRMLMFTLEGLQYRCSVSTKRARTRTVVAQERKRKRTNTKMPMSATRKRAHLMGDGHAFGWCIKSTIKFKCPERPDTEYTVMRLNNPCMPIRLPVHLTDRMITTLREMIWVWFKGTLRKGDKVQPLCTTRIRKTVCLNPNHMICVAGIRTKRFQQDKEEWSDTNQNRQEYLSAQNAIYGQVNSDLYTLSKCLNTLNPNKTFNQFMENFPTVFKLTVPLLQCDQNTVQASLKKARLETGLEERTRSWKDCQQMLEKAAFTKIYMNMTLPKAEDYGSPSPGCTELCTMQHTIHSINQTVIAIVP